MFSLNKIRRNYFFSFTWIPPSPGKHPKEQHTNHEGPRDDSSGDRNRRPAKQNLRVPSDAHAPLNSSQNPYIRGSHREACAYSAGKSRHLTTNFEQLTLPFTMD